MLKHCVYDFMTRNSLDVRRSTHVGQRLHSDLMQKKEDISMKIVRHLTKHKIPLHLFVNLDQTAIYYERKPTTTVHQRGANTISIRAGAGSSKQLTLCIAVAADCSNLPLFAIFKAKPGKNIEKMLSQITPPGVITCVQSKGWMDQRTTTIWYEKIWAPYAAGNLASLLLLDDFKCHKQKPFVDSYTKSTPIV